MTHDVTNFAEEVVRRSHDVPVLVDFWAEWCAPCRMLGPVLERLAERSGGAWVLAKVNTEVLQDVAAAYTIRSIPDVKLFHRGNVIAEFSGAMPEYMIVQWLKKHLPGVNDDALALARTLSAEGRRDEAIRSLEQILAQEPENAEGRTLLARLVLFEHPERALTLVTGVDEPEFSEAAGAVRTLSRLLSLASSGESLPDGDGKQRYLDAIDHLRRCSFGPALEGFIAVIRDHRLYDDDGARKACIAIFKYLGEDHPTTVAHRRDFSNALY